MDDDAEGKAQDGGTHADDGVAATLDGDAENGVFEWSEVLLPSLAGFGVVASHFVEVEAVTVVPEGSICHGIAAFHRGWADKPLRGRSPFYPGSRCSKKPRSRVKGGMVSVLYMTFRDGEGCQRCGTTENLTRDHIWPRSKGGCGCSGNFQVLCKECNEEKGNRHEGHEGHTKADCPQAEWHQFRERWKRGQRKFTRSEVEAMVSEAEGLRQKLLAYRCSLDCVKQAHTMVGTLRAFVRDYEKIRRQQRGKKRVTLQSLRKTEEKLITKLREVRDEIAKLEEKDRLRRLEAVPPPNYIVRREWGTGKEIPCDTAEEVRLVISRLPFNEGFVVTSPVGLEVGDFLPL